MIRYILLLSSCATMHALFEHDRAIVAGQRGDWQSAAHTLDAVLSKNPDSAAVLYDRGVAEYKLGSYEKAQVYFTNAASRADDAHLKEQAYFNEGNAYMFCEQFKHAIDSYDHALSLNPDNKQAEHNREIAKKMLEEQEQQKKDNEQSKDNDDKDENKQDQHNDSNESNDDQMNDDEQSKEQEKESDKQSSEQQKKQKERQERDEHDRADDRNRDQNKNDKQRQEEQQQQQPQQGNEEKKQHDTSQKEKKEKGNDTSKSNQAKGQEQLPDENKPEEKLEPWLAQLLDKQQEYDENMNKSLIKAMVSESSDEYTSGQQNW